MVEPDLSVGAVQFAIDVGLCVLIWLVQLVIYPSFRHWDAGKFRVAHRAYTRAISFIVIPLMVGQFGLCVYDIEGEVSTVHVVRLCVVIFAWLATFFIAVPCHKKLEQGWQPRVVQQLIRSNWIRTLLWSGLLLTWCGKSM